MSLKQKKIKLNHKHRCKRHQTSLITQWFIINPSPIYCLVTSPRYWTENWEFRLLLVQSYPYNSLKTIDFNAKNCQCKKSLNIRSWLQPARKRGEYLIKRFPFSNWIYEGTVATVEPPLMATSSQRLPLYNGYLFWWTVHTLTLVFRNLSTTATFFCPQGSRCGGEVQL